jgi:hypothetical protein
MIFVFGSNLAGRHGKGAALTARLNYGAKTGVGEGKWNQSYAIPTKDEKLKTRSLQDIEVSINRFLLHVRQYPGTKYKVTRIGCGLAGYKDEQIAPMFKDAPLNCIMPEEWQSIIGRSENDFSYHRW